MSLSDPHQSSKVSVSLKRGAHSHIFTRSPFFGRPGPKSLKIEATGVPKIYQNTPKTHLFLIFFLRDFQHRFVDQKRLQNGTPKWCPELLFGGLFSHACLGGLKAPFWTHVGLILKPQGSILTSFWLTFWPPKAQIWTHELPIIVPFVVVRFTKIFDA